MRLAHLEARLQPEFRPAWERFRAGGALPEHPGIRGEVVLLAGHLAEMHRRLPGGPNPLYEALLDRASGEGVGPGVRT